MQLILMRHGIAVDRSEGLPDFERPLTPKGRERTHQIAQWLHSRGDRWDALLSSPLLRARQTAEIAQQSGLAAEVEIFDALAPGGAFGELVNWWRSQQGIEAIAVVGHQPDLGEWVELAIWGQESGSIQLKKAGVAIVEFPGGRLRVGGGVLRELLTPKSMVGMG